MKRLATLLAAIAMAAPASAAKEEAPPSLLIVGLPHFGNPGLDIANTRVADVTTPERQREIEAVVAGLARFRPTRVAVEWPAAKQDKLDQLYADYRAGRHALEADETEQIGLRLAARLGLPRVDAVDWNDEPPGKDADYDFVAWADSHGRGADWQAYVRGNQAQADAEGKLMACTPVTAWVRRLNTPDYRRDSQRSYYDIAGFGDQAANPGAAWVGGWYARNLRILGNIRHVAAPGDRVIVIYGAGHGYLLDQQARESGAFEVADTLAWLPRSPRDAWTHCPE